MANVEVGWDQQDRFGRVRASRLRHTVESGALEIRDQGEFIAGSERRMPRQLSRVVAMGGGTGLPVVLAGLRRHLAADCRITAVVTVADDGGSSGLLRDQYNVLPPGDIRNCLIALADKSPEMNAALQYRFGAPSEAQHPVGNLLLTALGKVTGDNVLAIRLAAALLGIHDTVLPSTTNPVRLVADLVDGRCIRGESEIPRSGAAIARLRLDPPDADPAPGVLEALRTADMVVLGPGSLYTSILATMIFPGVAKALIETAAMRIFISNIMTEPGETDGYGVAAHLEALAAHGLPSEALDYVMVNSAPISETVAARYAAQGAVPVACDLASMTRPPLAVHADILEPGPVIRHAADKLAPILCALGKRHRWA